MGDLIPCMALDGGIKREAQEPALGDMKTDIRDPHGHISIQFTRYIATLHNFYLIPHGKKS